jgi:outer membrane protein OmpA-like peptidoglycan-associated protein
MTDDIDNCPNEKGPKSNNGCKLDDIDGDGVPNVEDLCPNEKGDSKFSGCPQLPNSLNDFINNNEIYFDFDSSETKASEAGKIDNLVKLLNKYIHINISINGHASFEGESLYNQLLSDRRANSIKLLIESGGIDSMRLKVNGFGEDQQKYPNTPPSERAKNRRVQFKID